LKVAGLSAKNLKSPTGGIDIPPKV
jgi:hypothetical protein